MVLAEQKQKVVFCREGCVAEGVKPGRCQHLQARLSAPGLVLCKPCQLPRGGGGRSAHRWRSRHLLFLVAPSHSSAASLQSPHPLQNQQNWVPQRHPHSGPPVFPARRWESEPRFPCPPTPTGSLLRSSCSMWGLPSHAEELSRGLHPLGAGRGTQGAATWTASSRTLSLQDSCVVSVSCLALSQSQPAFREDDGASGLQGTRGKDGRSRWGSSCR